MVVVRLLGSLSGRKGIIFFLRFPENDCYGFTKTSLVNPTEVDKYAVGHHYGEKSNTYQMGRPKTSAPRNLISSYTKFGQNFSLE